MNFEVLEKESAKVLPMKKRDHVWSPDKKGVIEVLFCAVSLEGPQTRVYKNTLPSQTSNGSKILLGFGMNSFIGLVVIKRQ